MHQPGLSSVPLQVDEDSTWDTWGISSGWLWPHSRKALEVIVHDHNCHFYWHGCFPKLGLYPKPLIFNNDIEFRFGMFGWFGGAPILGTPSTWSLDQVEKNTCLLVGPYGTALSYAKYTRLGLSIHGVRPGRAQVLRSPFYPCTPPPVALSWAKPWASWPARCRVPSARPMARKASRRTKLGWDPAGISWGGLAISPKKMVKNGDFAYGIKDFTSKNVDVAEINAGWSNNNADVIGKNWD